jgi:aldose 1-epimerase
MALECGCLACYRWVQQHLDRDEAEAPCTENDFENGSGYSMAPFGMAPAAATAAAAADTAAAAAAAAAPSPPSAAVHVVALRMGGAEVRVITYGAALQAVRVPGRGGAVDDVVLGFDSLQEYLSDANPFFGATVGRCAGRIGGVAGGGGGGGGGGADGARGSSSFALGGAICTLRGSDGGGGGISPSTNLHGGPRGFDKAVWRVAEMGREGEAVWVTLRHDSPDGDQGFPGALGVELSFRLRAVGAGGGVVGGGAGAEAAGSGSGGGGQAAAAAVELHLEYKARSSKATPVSLTNHSYWNLAGHGAAAGVGAHTVRMAPLRGWLQDDGSGSGVFTGAIGAAAGVHDWASADVALAPRLRDTAAQQPLWPHGDAYMLATADAPGFNPDQRAAARRLHPAVVVRDRASGRTMSVCSSEPVLQTYWSTLLDGVRGKGGRAYGRHGGLCLEMQRFANAVNVPAFPSCVVRPGTEYRQLTVHTFYVDGEGGDEGEGAQATDRSRA